MTNIKIIVSGPFSSGKTKFIEAVSERKVHFIDFAVTPQGDCIGMDFGRVEVDGDSALVLLGTPGGRRFSFDWLASDKYMVGYVIMVDSAKPVTFREAKGWI